MKKFLSTLLLAAALMPVASYAQVVVRVGPPAPIVETRPVRPGPEFEWIAGYHRWDGARYVWVPPETSRRRVEDRPFVQGHYVWRGGAWTWTPSHFGAD